MAQKLLLVTFAVALTLSVSAAETNSIDDSAKPSTSSPATEQTERPLDLGPAQGIIEAIYKKAMISALQQKVVELQTRLMQGENAIPAAVDILKISLLSNPTQQTIRKAAEHVLSIMSPEYLKSVKENGLLYEPTTLSPSSTTSSDASQSN
jgi:hypothetical protein